MFIKVLVIFLLIAWIFYTLTKLAFDYHMCFKCVFIFCEGPQTKPHKAKYFIPEMWQEYKERIRHVPTYSLARGGRTPSLTTLKYNMYSWENYEVVCEGAKEGSHCNMLKICFCTQHSFKFGSSKSPYLNGVLCMGEALKQVLRVWIRINFCLSSLWTLFCVRRIPSR